MSLFPRSCSTQWGELKTRAKKWWKNIFQSNCSVSCKLVLVASVQLLHCGGLVGLWEQLQVQVSLLLIALRIRGKNAGMMQGRKGVNKVCIDCLCHMPLDGEAMGPWIAVLCFPITHFPLSISMFQCVLTWFLHDSPKVFFVFFCCLHQASLWWKLLVLWESNFLSGLHSVYPEAHPYFHS